MSASSIPATSMLFRTAAFAVALSLAGCVGGSPRATPDATTGPSVTVTSTTPAPGDTTIPVPAENDPCVTGDRPFVQDGPMEAVGEPQTDSDLVAEISWQVHPSCERLAITFVTAEHAPAVDPPQVVPTFLRSSGVIRLTTGEAISGSAVIDQVVGTDLVDRVFVARGIDERIMLDVHLAEPAFVRVSGGSRQAQILMDVIPGGSDYPVPPTAGETTVVAGITSPEMRYPLTVSGYIFGDAEQVEATLTGSDGESTEVDAAIAPGETVWRAFDVVFPSGPTGGVVIVVGDAPPIDLTIP